MNFTGLARRERKQTPFPDPLRQGQALLLTEEQQERFWRDGFLAVPQFTTPDDLMHISALYDRMFETRAGWRDGNYFDLVGSGDDPDKFKIPHLQRITDYCPELLTTAYFRNCEAVASQLLRGRVKHLYDIAITKPGFSGAETPWHQDAAFLTEPSYFETVVFWMPLQPVDTSNGCMRFLPGSHRGPIVPHHSPGGDNRVNGLEAIGLDTAAAVACPLPAGGATIHHFRTLHGTGGNQTGGPRRVLTVGFGVRRSKPTIMGDFAWLAAKDNERLHRWRSVGALRQIKRLARPYVSRFMS